MDQVNENIVLERDYRRFDQFISRLVHDVYAEPPSDIHNLITQNTLQALHSEGLLRPGMRALDIGCGQGLALEKFRALGVDVVGITLGPDVATCRAKGLAVLEMDQNFMTFSAQEFDFLWCRHVLEHSVAPLFTLSEYKRVLKPGGLAYVEVPAPDTSAKHQENSNHYSVLPASAWLHLFAQAGFTVERKYATEFTLTCGKDTYWSFYLRNR